MSRSRPALTALATLAGTLIVACGSSDSSRRASGSDDAGTDGGNGDGDGGRTSTGGRGSGGGASAGGRSGGTGGASGGAGTGGAATGGAGARDAGEGGGDAGTDAGPDAGVTGPYVDCQSGTAAGDGGNGDLVNPFKTLAEAVAAASPGQAVLVLDGRCDETTEPSFGRVDTYLSVPDGVSFRAVNPGQVTFAGLPTSSRSSALKFEGSGEIVGIHFERFGNGISASTGTLRLEGVSFNDVTAGRPLILSGDVVATLDPGGLSNYIGANQHGFAVLDGTSKLTINGGAITGTTDSGLSGDAMFGVHEQSELILDGVTLKGNSLSGVVARGSSHVVIRNGTVFDGTGATSCCGQSSVHMRETSTLDFTDSTIDNGLGAGILCNAGTPTINVRRSSVTNCSDRGIVAPIGSNCRPTLTVEDTKLNGNRSGVYLNYGGEIRITDSEIDDNCGEGLYINDPAAAHTLFLRNTSVQRNCLYGMRLNGAAGSVFDLGRGDSPGGNTLVDNDKSGYANLRIEAPQALTIYAAGNTWNPGVQGAADSASTTPPPGQYAVVTGDVSDVSGPATGLNYSISDAAAATTILRLAEKACVPTGTCN